MDVSPIRSRFFPVYVLERLMHSRLLVITINTTVHHLNLKKQVASLHFNLGLAATPMHAATFQVLVNEMRFILELLDQVVGVLLALRPRTLITNELFRIASVVIRSIKELKFVLDAVLGPWHR